jgi:hypothetical protein
MPHDNHPHILRPVVHQFLHQIGHVVLGVPDLVLQAVRRVGVVLVRVELALAHLEARERAPVDLVLHAAVCGATAGQHAVQVREVRPVVFNQPWVARHKVDEVGAGSGLPARLRGRPEVNFGSWEEIRHV